MTTAVIFFAPLFHFFIMQNQKLPAYTEQDFAGMVNHKLQYNHSDSDVLKPFILYRVKGPPMMDSGKVYYPTNRLKPIPGFPNAHFVYTHLEKLCTENICSDFIVGEAFPELDAQGTRMYPYVLKWLNPHSVNSDFVRRR
jgi:hypothetical protein